MTPKPVGLKTWPPTDEVRPRERSHPSGQVARRCEPKSAHASEFQLDAITAAHGELPISSADCGQPQTHLENILGLPVAVVVAPTLQVPELRRFVGHGVTDDVARADAVFALQETQQGQDRTDLRCTVEDLLIGPGRAVALRALDHLDTDRLVVQANRV